MWKKFNPLWILLVVFALAFPWVVEGTSWSFLVRLGGLYGITLLLVLGLNMVVGYVGLLDLGFAAFFGLGAYTTALLSLQGWSFWLCLPLSALVAGAMRALIGIPVLRLKGDYLAIVTLAFGEIVRITLNNWDGLTQGPKGLSLLSSSSVPPVRLMGMTLAGNRDFYYLILAAAVGAAGVCQRLDRSRIGRAWLAIRENEIAALAMGVPAAELKNVAFILSGIFAGVAGALFARWDQFVTPESFTFWDSVLLLSAVVLGGRGSIPGALLGAGLVVGLPELLRAEGLRHWLGSSVVNARYLIFGLLLVIMAVARPQGLWPRREHE